MKKLLSLAVVLLLGGCAIWQPVGGPYTADNINFSADLPPGWMRVNNSDYLLITRDGVFLQRIAVSRLELNKEKQFEHTKKRLTKEMLPHEQAEVVLDEVQSDQSALNFRVEENVPATVAGVPAFRVTYTFQDKSSSLTYRGIYHGFISGDWFYRIMYVAPNRYYFDKDKAAYDGVLKSFRLIKTG